MATARYVGMILGVGIAGAIFTTILSRHTSMALFEGVNAGFFAASLAAFLGCLTSAVRKEVRPGVLPCRQNRLPQFRVQTKDPRPNSRKVYPVR